MEHALVETRLDIGNGLIQFVCFLVSILITFKAAIKTIVFTGVFSV